MLEIPEMGLECTGRGAWVAQSVDSGHDLVVPELEPRVGLCATAQSMESASDSVSRSLFPSLSYSHSVSLSQK